MHNGIFQLTIYKDRDAQARIQDFRQGGPAEFWPQGGALSPNFAQNRGFSLKNAWKLHDFEEILGARGARASLDPLLDDNVVCFVTLFQLSLAKLYLPDVLNIWSTQKLKAQHTLSI